MQRILIIGCGGAGKSTLARQLGQKMNLPVVHLDKLFWKPGWEESSDEEIDEKIFRELEKPQWIMDGNFGRTLPRRLEYCDTVIWLDYPRLTCFLGVLKRVITTYGTVRPDMGEGCPERFDWDFLKWVWGFNRKNRKRFQTLLDDAPQVQTVRLKNRRQTRGFLKSV